jgi:hypothetical protein
LIAMTDDRRRTTQILSVNVCVHLSSVVWRP